MFPPDWILGRGQVVKAPVFGIGIRRFESSRPSQLFNKKGLPFRRPFLFAPGTACRGTFLIYTKRNRLKCYSVSREFGRTDYLVNQEQSGNLHSPQNAPCGKKVRSILSLHIAPTTNKRIKRRNYFHSLFKKNRQNTYASAFRLRMNK
jgi:hypothetical protein